MIDEHGEGVAPTNVIIKSPLNNAKVPPVPISVIGTTPLGATLPIVLRLYKGGGAVGHATAVITGNEWSATLSGLFEPASYELRVTQADSTSITLTVEVPAPIIDTPTSNCLVDMPFQVTGKKGVYSHGSISLYTSPGNILIKSGITVASNGSWTTSIMLPTNVSGFVAKQKIGIYESAPSSAVTGLRLNPPTIEKPAQNEAVNSRPEIKGKGIPGSKVTVWQTGTNKTLVTDALVGNDRVWAKISEVELLGTVNIKAKVKLNGLESPDSLERTFTVLGTPLITSPAPGSFQETTFTVGGNNGQADATVHVLLDLTTVEVGKSAVLTGAAWTASVKVEPGPVSLVSKQVKGQIESGRSHAVAFKIRPPALTAVSITFPTETSVKFSGTGHTDATVEITVVSGPGGTAPPPALVTSGKWETTATNWKFGEYSLKAIQKVSDNANGWIESQPYTFSASKVFPDPTDVTYTTDYQPTFSGKGLVGATVKLLTSINGPAIAPDAHVSNGVWSSKASAEWGPTLNREIFIKQYLNGQESPNWVKPKVTIAPLAPVVNAPVENGLSPKFSGTCWTNAVVELTFSGSTTKWPATVTGTSWTFQRETPFAPDVTHTVSVTQTAAQQASPPASKTFVVYAPIPKPVITVPEPGSEVGRDMTVQGTSGMKGATMQLRDAQFGRDLGEPKLLTVDGGWSIDLIGLGFRQYIIEAKQVRNQRPSEPSEPRTFDVVLLPPVITLPIENGDLPRTSTLLGTAMPGGRVTVWREDVAEPLCENIPVDTGGRWKAEVTLPVGVKTIRARQTFEKQTSKDSPPRRYNVVPAAPLIETPATGEHIGRRVVVSGFGVPGDTVTVKLGNATHTVLGRSPVLEDRTWSVAVEFDQPGGRYGLVAVASCDGFDSSDSPGRPVVLGTYWPVIESPAAGRWVSNPIEFKGQGRQGVGQVVSWFNPDQVWAPDLPVTGGRWQGEARQSLPQGGQWCRLKQSITDSTDGATVSDWVDSQRFEVPPSSAES